MINEIYGDEFVMTSHSSRYSNSTQLPPSAVPGTVWYSDQRLKVYTGYGWEDAGAPAYITLSHDLKQIINWAKDKMDQERREAELHEKFPALKQAKDNYEKRPPHQPSKERENRKKKGVVEKSKKKMKKEIKGKRDKERKI